MTDKMPDEIFAYHDIQGTGTWIGFDDSCKGDEATKYIRSDLVQKLQEENEDHKREIGRLFLEKEDLRIAIIKHLYPNGIKHPQQATTKWLVKALREHAETIKECGGEKNNTR